MLFTRLQLDCFYNVGNINKLYEDLENIYPNSELSIVWRSGTKKTLDCNEADSVEIKKDNKTMFSAIYKNSKGILRLSVLEGRDEEVFKAIKQNNLMMDDGPSFAIGVLCAVLYVMLFLFILFLQSDIFEILLGAGTLMFLGLGAYTAILSSSRSIIGLRVSSVVGGLGLIALAPASMLMFPLLLAISKSRGYALIAES